MNRAGIGQCSPSDGAKFSGADWVERMLGDDALHHRPEERDVVEAFLVSGAEPLGSSGACGVASSWRSTPKS